MKRAWATLALACLALAVAFWLLPASIHIVSWPPSGPMRVGMFGRLPRLWRALALSVVLFGSGAAFWRHVHRSDIRVLARIISPLTLLWLWAVPFLPWLPDRAPLLLVLAGPLRWIVAAVACAGVAWSYAMVSGWKWTPRRLPGRKTVFAVSLALYLAFGMHSAQTLGPGADEPHYLIIAHSLLVDHDLAIENNHARGDYRAFFRGELRPDFLRRGLDDVIYSIHAPGLPVLLLPGYALAGYVGAVATMCLFGALTALAIFDLAALLAGPVAGWLTWLSVCATVPFVPHAWLLFPEMAGALIVSWAVTWLCQPGPDRVVPWVWRGAVLGVLPWLHTKFSVLLAMLGAFLLIRLWPRVKCGIAFMLPIAASSGLWLYSFHVMYGVFDPEAPYGGYARTHVLIENIPRSLLGLFFDQKFGLFWYAPVYLLAAAGCWLMVRRSSTRLAAIACAASAAVFVASSARLYMWWGGSSAPARFLVPILPMAAPMLAVAIGELRGEVSRAVLTASLGVSLLIAAAGIVAPGGYFFSEPHGHSRLAEAIEAAAPLTYALPTFTEEDWHTPLRRLAPWLIAGLAGFGAATLYRRRGSPPTGSFWTGVAGVLAFAAVAVVASSRFPAAARAAIVDHGRAGLMYAYDSPRLRAFDYASVRRLDDRALLRATAIDVTRVAGEPFEDPRRLAGPFTLLPGRYEARLWFDGLSLPQSDLLVRALPDAIVARVSVPAGDPAVMAFAVPVEIPAAWIGVLDAKVAAAARRIQIVPQALVSRSARKGVDVRVIEAIEGRPQGLLAYIDDDTFPEGGVFWTRGTRRGEILVAPDGASTILLTLHVGTAAGTIRIVAAGEERTVTLSRDETRQVSIPVPLGTSLVPISIQAPGGFHPADVDPASRDTRWLGCQVRVALR